MRWSITLATIAGTTVRIHLTFLLLVAWIGALYFTRGGWASALDGVLFVLLVFACVVLHEFGHVAVARRYGIRTPDITLFPFGGVASLERMPERPGPEILVALAGPAVNVVIAAVLFLLLGARFDLADATQLQDASMSLAGRLAVVNLLLVGFNLIPAFPTDGGRVLRALLALRFDRVKATRIAAVTGQVFAALFVFLGLFGNPILLLIGIFIWLAAGAETRMVEERALAEGRFARDAMVTRFETLAPEATAADAGRLLLATTQQEFPVLGPGGRLEGFVTRTGLIEAMNGGGPTTPVADFMAREVPTARADTPLTEVMEALARSNAVRAVAILDRSGGLAGYVSLENLSELMMLSRARGGSGPDTAGGHAGLSGGLPGTEPGPLAPGPTPR